MKSTQLVRLAALSLAVLAAAAPQSQAAFVVTGGGAPENGLFSSLSREAPRVLQQFYDDVDFASITSPKMITAMSFRLPTIAGADYPALGDLNFARYDITLAKPSAAVAAANGLTSATFADNMMDPVVVRSGPLNVPLGAFESNDDTTVPSEFSFIINFQTPYNFTPGQDLVMIVRHSGHGDVNGVETRWNFDGYAYTNGSVVSTTADVDAPVGNFGPGSFNLANRIQFTVVPEPAGGLLFAAGAAAAAIVRRRTVC